MVINISFEKMTPDSSIQEMSLKEPLTWKQVSEIVDSYELQQLGRSIPQLKSYHDFKNKLKSKGINLTTNLVVNTLHWLPADFDIHRPAEDAVSVIRYEDARPFCNSHDVCITLNDFPYYIKERTLHLLVWVKFPMPPDTNSDIGDIDDETKKYIEKYINNTFVEGLNVQRDRIIWWKNYTLIQSIKSIPHIHVLINLDGDVDGKLEKEVMRLVGTSGVMFQYPESKECKL